MIHGLFFWLTCSRKDASAMRPIMQWCRTSHVLGRVVPHCWPRQHQTSIIGQDDCQFFWVPSRCQWVTNSSAASCTSRVIPTPFASKMRSSILGVWSVKELQLLTCRCTVVPIKSGTQFWFTMIGLGVTLVLLAHQLQTMCTQGLGGGWPNAFLASIWWNPRIWGWRLGLLWLLGCPLTIFDWFYRVYSGYNRLGTASYLESHWTKTLQAQSLQTSHRLTNIWLIINYIYIYRKNIEHPRNH